MVVVTARTMGGVTVFSPKGAGALPTDGELLEMESYIIANAPRVVRETLGDNPSPEWRACVTADYLSAAWPVEEVGGLAIAAYSLLMHGMATGLFE